MYVDVKSEKEDRTTKSPTICVFARITRSLKDQGKQKDYESKEEGVLLLEQREEEEEEAVSKKKNKNDAHE